jgi:N-acetylmuramoyl-L-alanine amidase
MPMFSRMGLVLVAGALGAIALPQSAFALSVVYPPPEHETTADRLFFIGTADPDQPVTINGTVVERSPAGHFAPSIPLDLGLNTVTLQQGDRSLTFSVLRRSAVPTLAAGELVLPDSLQPTADLALQPGERVCFEAIADPRSRVTVDWAGQALTLTPRSDGVTLPPNYAVLTGDIQPLPHREAIAHRGCTIMPAPGAWGAPTYRITLGDQQQTIGAAGEIQSLEPTAFDVAAVIVDSGTARTGPSTSYSRLTPLPRGSRSTVTGRQGDWVRLEYGAWIRASEVEIRPSAAPVQAQIRGIQSRSLDDWTEILFPLDMPVPVTVRQSDRTLTLTLHHTTAQTDTIFVDRDAVIERMDWYQPRPGQVDYTITLATSQAWGYTLDYRGTTLVLSLRRPPDRRQASRDRPLTGISILLDPGHGSDEDLGARGPTGYPEKDVALVISQLVRDELEARGATVVMTREGDDDLFPQDRVDQILAQEPTLALSLHYNALPDAGDALNTAGIGTFWYHAQAHDLSVFLHDYLVETLNRPSYGVFWNNLALTRPTVTPSVLLELGFMINPYEFEWIVDPVAQQELAIALADALVLWFQRTTP